MGTETLKKVLESTQANGSQPWLHSRIIQGTYKAHQSLGPTPEVFITISGDDDRWVFFCTSSQVICWVARAENH